MTIMLTPKQSKQWDEGGWLSLELQETILEDLNRQGVTEPVAVVLADDTIAFYVTAPGVIL